MSAEAASGAIASVFRDEAGQVVGALVRATGDFALAEDAVQDAIVEALRRWPQAGVPERPGAWLMAAARRKAIDRLRREARLARKVELLGRLEGEGNSPPLGQEARQVIDDRLVLIFTCCHPALSREAQIALTLRSVVGLTTAQIARAFLAAEPAVAQRIVRAKRKIVGAGIPFRVPSG
ncbi:MAG: sigma factor, partial [Candidatus Dormibacterales bacterium]